MPRRIYNLTNPSRRDVARAVEAKLRATLESGKERPPQSPEMRAAVRRWRAR